MANVITEGAASAYFSRLTKLVNSVDCSSIDEAVGIIRTAWVEGRQIVTLGNGGSAMTALHFATDWSKGISQATGKPFRARSLVDNVGVLTAYSNDMSYSDALAEQLPSTVNEGDLLIAISGSGNSENVVRAVNRARTLNCKSIALCGFSGGRLKNIADCVVWVDSNDMQLCEDLHSIFGHIVMQTLCSHSSQS